MPAAGRGVQAAPPLQGPGECGDSTLKIPLGSKYEKTDLKWPCSSVGDESFVHRFCIYVAHLGQVHTLIDLAASICHLKKKKEKTQHILDQKV
ncbi:hypothetical protein H671_2g6781 [Cricetulus griseus]|nr:hypothetical protein H671_2g6781 [Cricetulus griseus]